MRLAKGMQITRIAQSRTHCSPFITMFAHCMVHLRVGYITRPLMKTWGVTCPYLVTVGEGQPKKESMFSKIIEEIMDPFTMLLKEEYNNHFVGS